MKTTLIAHLAVAAVAVASSSAIVRADGAASPANWAGFYAGVGVGWSNAEASDAYDLVTPFDFDADGFRADLLAGYNFQSASWAFGIEGDVSFGSIEGTGLCTGATIPACLGTGTRPHLEIETAASIRARLGYASERVLFFGTVGYGYADATVTDPLQAGQDSQTHDGIVYGAGVDWMCGSQTSVRLEYLHSDYNANNYALVTTPDKIEFDTDEVRAAVSWHF